MEHRMEQKTLASFDGTPISYQVHGSGDRWIVVANGYGGSFWAWTDLFALLRDRYRLLIWDYRGLYSSGRPRDPSRLRIEDHCLDLDLMLESEGIRRYAMAGWSVGVQVALEQYRRRPEGIDALLLINGAHGRVLHRSGDGLVAGLVMPWVVGPWSHAMRVLGPLLLPPARLAARSSLPIRFFAAAGLVSGTPASLHEALRGVLTMDWSMYLRMARLADEHDTEDMLASVRVPTLVTAGDRDIITRPRLARGLASRIPGAVYFELPGATHYAVMELPRLLANRIEAFLSDT